MAGVRDVEHLLRPGGYTDRLRCPDIGRFHFEVSVAVEGLDALFSLIGDIHHALRVDCNAVDDVELSGSGAARPPVPDPFAVLVVLRHARVAIAVGHIDVAGCIPRNVGRAIEAFTGWSCAGERRSAAATATFAATLATAALAPALPTRFGNRLNDGDSCWKRLDPRSRNAQRLRLAAEDQLDPSVRVELDNLCRHLIHDPHVVLRIDPHLLGLQEPIRALRDLTNELARAVELKQARSTVCNRP